MNDLHLEAFLEIIRLNSYTKAAEKLLVPQPTLTHRIKQLENEIGDKLIHRTQKGVSLTAAGKIFFPYARQSYEMMIKGKQELENVRKGIAGVLSIGASLTLSQYLLPPFLQQLMTKHPDLRLSIDAHPSEIIVKKVQEKKLIFGFSRSIIADTNLVFELLTEDKMYLIVPPDHPFIYKENLNLAEICEEPLFIYQEGTSFRDIIVKSLLEHNLILKQPIEINHAELIKAMVKSGFGITFLPKLYAQNEIDNGELVAIDMKDNPFLNRGTYLVYSKNNQNQNFKYFIDFTKEFFK